MPIPSFDQTLLRGTTHIVKPKLNIFPTEIIATATVYETPELYPVGEVEVSDVEAAWGNVKPGMAFDIRTATGELVTYGVIRKPVTLNTMYIDGKSRGDAGRAARLLRALEAGQQIRVFSYQPLWSLLSRIKEGIFYKKFDIPYIDEGSEPSPVCNIGKWRQVDANAVTGYGRVSFDNVNSFAWLDRVINTYIWEIPSSAIVVSGSVDASNITLDLPPGFHRVYCTIIDGNGKSQTSMRPVWVNDPVEYPAVNDLYGLVVESDSQNKEGRTITFRVYGDVPDDLIMPGGAVLFTHKGVFDYGLSLSEGVEVDTFVGFISQESIVIDAYNGQKSISFEAKSPYLRFSDLPMVSQAIVEKSVPADWTEVALGLGNPNFVAYYILKHHTTYMDLFDFDPFPLEFESDTGNDGLPDIPQKRNWGLNGGTVTEYLNQTAPILGGVIGSRSDGTITMRRDPQIEELSLRDTIDERFVWNINDITEPPEFPERFTPEVGQLKAFAFAYDGSEEPIAVASVAPGFVQGQGVSKQDEETILVGNPLTAQDKINRVAGHLYAKRNNPTPEIQLKINRNIDIAEPVLNVWHRIVVPALYNPRGYDIDTRILPTAIDRSWENIEGSWVKRISISFEPETFGQPGETYIVDTGGGSIYPPFQPPGIEGGNFVPPKSTNKKPIDFKRTYKFVAAINTSGDVGLTFNGLNWKNITPQGNRGLSSDIAVQWDSPYIKSGFVSGALKAWMVNVEGDSIHAYYTENLLADQQPRWARHTTFFGASGGDIRGSARVLTHRYDANYVVILWHDPEGVKLVFTLDGGSTWSNLSGTKITSVVTPADTENSRVALGADMDTNGAIVTSGITSLSPLTYKMFRISKGSTTPAVVANSPSSNIPFTVIALNRDNSGGYCGTGETTVESDVTGEVDFTTNTFTRCFTTIQEGSLMPYAGPTVGDPPTALYDYLEPDLPPGTYTIGPVEYDILLDGVWTVSEFVVDLSYYYQHFAGEYRYGYVDVTFIDKNGIEVHNYYGETEMVTLLPGDDFNIFTVTGLPLENINKVKIKAGFGGDYYFVEQNEGSWFAQIGTSQAVFKGTSVRTFSHKMYRFQSYSSVTAAFTNISPDGIWAPFFHYGVSIDRVLSTQVSAICQNANGTSIALFVSNDRGDTWEALGLVNYYGLQKISDTAILFGGDFDLSDDGGENLGSIIGDWVEVMNNNEAGIYRAALSSSTIV